jgi:hypothetical protein
MEGGHLKVCSICALPLVKQFIHNNAPLNEVELEELEHHVKMYRRILECRRCGLLCYNKDDAPVNGKGFCEPCGGPYTLSRPGDILPLECLKGYNDYCMIWSCPVHGVV